MAVEEILDEILLLREELAALREELRKARKPKSSSSSKPSVRSEVHELTDFFVDHRYVFYHRLGKGRVREFLCVAPSDAFLLCVKVDRDVLWKKRFDEFEKLSRRLDGIYAAVEDGDYVLHLSDISFSRELEVELLVDAPLTFKKLYIEAKYSSP